MEFSAQPTTTTSLNDLIGNPRPYVTIKLGRKWPPPSPDGGGRKAATQSLHQFTSCQHYGKGREKEGREERRKAQKTLPAKKILTEYRRAGEEKEPPAALQQRFSNATFFSRGFFSESSLTLAVHTHDGRPNGGQSMTPLAGAGSSPMLGEALTVYSASISRGGRGRGLAAASSSTRSRLLMVVDDGRRKSRRRRA